MFQFGPHLTRSAQIAAKATGSRKQLVPRAAPTFGALVSQYVAKEREHRAQEARWAQHHRQGPDPHCQALLGATGLSTGLVLGLLHLRHSELFDKSKRSTQDSQEGPGGQGQESQWQLHALEDWLADLLLEAHSAAQRACKVLGRLTNRPDFLEMIRMQMTPRLPPFCFALNGQHQLVDLGVQSLASRLPIRAANGQSLASTLALEGTNQEPSLLSLATTLTGSDKELSKGKDACQPVQGDGHRMDGTAMAPPMLSALAQFEKAINTATPRGENALGIQQSKAHRDHEAASLFAEASAHGYAKAQYNLGVCYSSGRGVPKDTAKAAQCFQEAATQGHAKAMYNLGVYHLQGEGGCQPDCAKAAALFESAAEKGLGIAQHSLALCHEHGRGMPPDQAKAVAWYRKAASQGHVGSQHHMGQCYEEGKGVAMDYAKAARMYQAASSRGHQPATVSLGRFYANGLGGLPRNPQMARKLLTKAAANGSAEATSLLSSLYGNGGGLGPCEVTSAYFAALAGPMAV